MESNTSDALQHPPSFDEMVGLIKKLFTDYLEDVMKSTPEEISKSWERYKTLNHLWQDNAQPGPRWVKCSDRLPGYKLRVKWRDGNDHSYATDGEISMFEMEKPNLEGWEWLDEQPEAGREDDAVVFAQWLATERWQPRINTEWARYETIYSDISVKTTTELYELFKQHNP